MDGMTSDKTLRESIIESLEESRNNILDGNVNCIPLPFERYREDFPGIRKKFYYLVSGATKSSKTQITNYLFVMTPIFYYIDHPDQVVPKIFYFPLEETPEGIMERFIQTLFFTFKWIYSHATSSACNIGSSPLCLVLDAYSR
mgnify:CR=1 FL=1